MQSIEGVSYLTTQELAEVLRIRPETIRRHRCDGRSPVPYLKLGASVLYRASDVATYLARLGR